MPLPKLERPQESKLVSTAADQILAILQGLDSFSDAHDTIEIVEEVLWEAEHPTLPELNFDDLND